MTQPTIVFSPLQADVPPEGSALEVLVRVHAQALLIRLEELTLSNGALGMANLVRAAWMLGRGQRKSSSLRPYTCL